MKLMLSIIGLLGMLAIVAPAEAQWGSLLDKGRQGLDQLKDLQITESEEREIGAQVSARLRERFGVVQDPVVHKYVALVGSVLASASSRPGLPWTFIVLDTDGVNAFAAPGGYIHITRGALALLQNESELAGVLGHEMTHVTAKHTIRAIQKAKLVQMGQSLARSELLGRISDAAYASIIENGFDRSDETEADKIGVALANKAGYAPGGLGAFLTRLDDRNKDQQHPNGLFASHPDTKTRIDRLAKQIVSDRLAATAIVAARYHASITYKPTDLISIAVIEEGANGLTSSGGTSTGSTSGGGNTGNSTKDPKAADPKKPASGGFGLGKLTTPLGGEKQGTQAVASGGSRGVGGDRDAKGGGNPAIIIVTITPAELEAFRIGIAG
jgi:hypothetical protein